jgi:hypothetical protein
MKEINIKEYIHSYSKRFSYNLSNLLEYECRKLLNNNIFIPMIKL